METAQLAEKPKTKSNIKSEPDKNESNSFFSDSKPLDTLTPTPLVPGPFFAPDDTVAPVTQKEEGAQNDTTLSETKAEQLPAKEDAKAASVAPTPSTAMPASGDLPKTEGDAAVKEEAPVAVAETPVAEAGIQNIAADIPATVNDAAAAEQTPEPVPDKDGLMYLDATETEGVLKTKLLDTASLAKSNSKTKSAGEKINESIKAQNTTAAEAQSDANAGKVTAIAKKNIPPAQKNAAQKTLSDTLDKVVPTTKEGLEEFTEQNKSAIISQALIHQVSRDVGAVKSAFVGIQKPAKPAPAKAGKPLPADPATKVNSLNLAAGILPAIKKQFIDTDKYSKEADATMKKEGITAEQLNMVDKGPLAEAKKARKQLDDDAVKMPAAVKDTADKEHTKLAGMLSAEQSKSRDTMANKRQGKVNEIKEKQVKVKIDLEKEHEKFATTINARFAACQKSVTQKLKNLEANSLAQFNTGQDTATKEFVTRVDARVNKYFSDRHNLSNQGIKNWWKDLGADRDSYAQVKKIFAEERRAYVAKIDKQIEFITNHNNAVIKECKDEVEATRHKIEEDAKKLSPELRNIGKKAQDEISQKLDNLTKDIDKEKVKLQKLLVDKRKSAMVAIDNKIAAMKLKMKGALSIVGDFLVNAAKKFITYALELVGMDAESFFKLLEKAGQAVKAIFDDPAKFFSNLVAAVKGSINDFVANFKKYLTSALFDWLMGAIGSVVTLPEKWDVKGVLSVILQLAGISWAFIRKKLVDIFGEEKVAFAEEKVAAVKEIVERFLKEGVIGIWEWIKDQAETMMATVIEGIKDWLLTKLVVGFAEWIVSLLVPGGAVMKLIQGIYKLIMWFVDNIQRIMRWVTAIVNSLGNVAVGAIPAAIGFIVDAMKTMIPVILDFFAKLLNIGGIIDAIQKMIDKIMAPIHKAIDKVVAWIKDMIQKLVKKFKGGGAEEEEQPVEDENQEHLDDSTVGKVVHFSADGESHRLWIDTSGSGVEVMVASTPMTVRERLAKWRDESEKLDGEEQAHAKSLLDKADSEYQDLLGEARISDHDIKEAKEADASDEKVEEAEKQDNIVEEKESEISSTLKELFDIFGEEHELPESEIKFKHINADGYILGHKMDANILTKEGPQGSKPGESNEIYTALSYRKDRGRLYYVHGHLLNQNLHGPGTLENMTPLFQQGNTNHLIAAEKAIKKAVDGDGIVDYFITVVYDRTVPEVTDEQLENAGFITLEDKEIIRMVRKAEKYVPQGLTLESYTLKRSGNSYVRDKVLVSDTSTLNPIDLNLSNYLINFDKREDVSVLTSTAEKISKNTGILLSEIEIIKDIAQGIKNLWSYDQIKILLPQNNSKLIRALDKLRKLDNVTLK
jgi:hypothetical protein